jgi:hypothetical protein
MYEYFLPNYFQFKTDKKGFQGLFFDEDPLDHPTFPSLKNEAFKTMIPSSEDAIVL